MVVEGRYEVSPLRSGVSLAGRHMGVTSGWVGHQSVPSACICGASVEEGQQGPIRNRLRFQALARRSRLAPGAARRRGRWGA